MDALAAEIARKRQLQQDAKSALGGGGGPRKWVKRGEVEQVREKKYLEETAREAEEQAKKVAAPQFRVQVELDPRSSAAPAGDDGAVVAASNGSAAAAATAQASAVSSSSRSTADKDTMKPAEVKRKLRLLGQPIQLFGEDDDDRLERYRAVSSALPSESEVNDQLKAGQTWGQNESQLFDASGKTKQMPGDAQLPKAVDGTNKEDDDEGEDELAPTFVATTPEQTVSRHFKQLVQLWEKELAERPAQETASAAGRSATAAFQQAKRHMRPFFRLLRTREMPLDVLGTMVEITTFMQQREYVKAHDAYIRCAIGNAPWPMGITGTGIHERQGRQHLRESKVAHVMNDETQRKYLQSVKRLLTFAQRVMPPDGPSKLVQ